jgi:hypothetical protein
LGTISRRPQTFPPMNRIPVFFHHEGTKVTKVTKKNNRKMLGCSFVSFVFFVP